ncbi:hypothetical protein J8273_2782 [Carpediemonas membranifera]|uniref:Uncharacterized protein n=1 Tax=Carpediemonas membranifera TaxID=201153 RepID=A0A8J6E5D0_9EUKA|nr:hypothetical protein J8273_2782 [Carpediemonas membranifera]|eukprot:KAG9395587.1 hypothetical protein J8273_2782 [Carpediemonas membranifera]
MEAPALNKRFMNVNPEETHLDFFKTGPVRIAGFTENTVDLKLPNQLASFEQKCDSAAMRLGIHMADRMKMDRAMLSKIQPFTLDRQAIGGAQTILEDRQDLLRMEDFSLDSMENLRDHRERLEARAGLL